MSQSQSANEHNKVANRETERGRRPCWQENWEKHWNRYQHTQEGLLVHVCVCVLSSPAGQMKVFHKKNKKSNILGLPIWEKVYTQMKLCLFLCSLLFLNKMSAVSVILVNSNTCFKPLTYCCLVFSLRALIYYRMDMHTDSCKNRGRVAVLQSAFHACINVFRGLPYWMC